MDSNRDVGVHALACPSRTGLDFALSLNYKQWVKLKCPILSLGLFLIVGAMAYWWWHEGRLERSQDEVIRAASQRYGIETALIKAIVWQESRFNPLAQGRAQEIGLMQLREDAAREWADAEHVENFQHEHCFDSRTNTLAGAWYLKKLLKRYSITDNPLPYALADYNAGRGNVLKWISGAAATNSSAFLNQIGFPGTREYVTSVMERYARYGRGWTTNWK